MRNALWIIIGAALWPLAASTPAQAQAGSLEPVSGRAGCLAPVKEKRCLRLRPVEAGKRAGGWTVAADGRGAVGLLGDKAVVAVRRTGSGGMRQVTGRRGCVAAKARLGCTVDKRLRGASSTALSPDGRLVAVAGTRYKPATCGDGSPEKDCFAGADFLLVLRRDPSTGALRAGRKAGACLAGRYEAIGTRPGRIPGCKRPKGDLEVATVRFGPEGRSLYAAGGGSLLSFAVSGSGEIAPATGTPCFAGLTSPPAGCASAPGLNGDSGAEEVTITADGRALYVRTPGRFNREVGAGSIGTIAAFTRDPSTGALATIPAPGGCYENGDPLARRGDEGAQGRANQPGTCTAAPLDSDIYSFTAVGNTLVADGEALFAKDDVGRLIPGQTLDVRGIADVVGSPVRFGTTLTYASAVYSAEEGTAMPGSLATVGIGAETGDAQALSQQAGGAGCVSGDTPGAGRQDEAYGSTAGCLGPVGGLVTPTPPAISPDGASAYVFAAGKLSAFSRDPATGALAPLGGRARCVGAKDPCRRSRALAGGETIVVSADGRRVTLFGRGIWTFRRK